MLKSSTNGILIILIVKGYWNYMNLSIEDKQIENLRNLFLETNNDNTRMEIFDTLATYGNKGLDTISDLVNNVVSPNIKSHGLKILREAQEST